MLSPVVFYAGFVLGWMSCIILIMLVAKSRGLM